MNWRRAGVPALWLACLAVASLIVVRARYVTGLSAVLSSGTVVRARYVTDLSAFLPANPTPTQQLLVDQLRDGPTSRLILIAIEGGGDAARARASIATASRLRRDRQFASVNNGEPVTAERDREFLFQHRYLLSDRVTAERFSESGLRAAIEH